MHLINDENIKKYIRYRAPGRSRKTVHNKSIKPYGLDTEADIDGRCFLICTSEGDIWRPEDWPNCLFTRKYKNAKFVVYNLRYDSGALLQHLPIDCLKELQTDGKIVWNNIRYTIINYKCLAIRRNKDTVHIYDMFGFFHTSLERAAQKYLGEGKKDISTKRFTDSYINTNWDTIVEYCIQDARLVARLAALLVETFESFGVYPRKLYSTAYVSWQYFRNFCEHIHVARYWQYYPEVLAAAMAAYSGGKFEVTRKGLGVYHEYDIISAYPAEIAKLIDIRNANVERVKKYRKAHTYAFYKISIDIPLEVNNPVPVKRKLLNVFPSGMLEKWITKEELEYFYEQNLPVNILDGFALRCNSQFYPYADRIRLLMERKQAFAVSGDSMRYHTVKIFLNSLYGKMAQLIPKGKIYEAGAAWNPIYAAIITANVRLRVTRAQQQFPEIVAVHTDSLIATEPLNISLGRGLGDWSYQTRGYGVILGCGVYQIGDKSRFRGFPTKEPLLGLLPRSGKVLRIDKLSAISWKEVAHRNLSVNRINRFETRQRNLAVAFDKKRCWLEDWNDYAEVRDRPVESLPLVSTPLGILL